MYLEETKHNTYLTILFHFYERELTEFWSEIHKYSVPLNRVFAGKDRWWAKGVCQAAPISRKD